MITVLICSVAALICTPETAIEVIKLRQQGLMCNPYPELAAMSIGRDLRPDERVVVKCPHR